MTAFDEQRLSRRGRIQLVCAAISALLTVLTALVPRWIEEVTALEPDGGNGELEWLLPAAFGAVSLVLGLLAYRTRRRLLAIQT